MNCRTLWLFLNSSFFFAILIMGLVIFLTVGLPAMFDHEVMYMHVKFQISAVHCSSHLRINNFWKFITCKFVTNFHLPYVPFKKTNLSSSIFWYWEVCQILGLNYDDLFMSSATTIEIWCRNQDISAAKNISLDTESRLT